MVSQKGKTTYANDTKLNPIATNFLLVFFVIPAEAGIQRTQLPCLDSGFRRNDLFAK
jgi:hypothetical protein